MPEDVFLEPCRFTAAAKHYLAGRPAYAKGLISWVVKDLRLGEKDAVMDLGCGPGTLAMLFAPFVGSVLAIDPCPECSKSRATLQKEWIMSTSNPEAHST